MNDILKADLNYLINQYKNKIQKLEQAMNEPALSKVIQLRMQRHGISCQKKISELALQEKKYMDLAKKQNAQYYSKMTDDIIEYKNALSKLIFIVRNL